MSQQNQHARHEKTLVIVGVLLLAGLLALGLGRLRHARAAAPLAGGDLRARTEAGKEVSRGSSGASRAALP